MITVQNESTLQSNEARLPDVFQPKARLDAVFDHGNAHVSRIDATHFVVLRYQIDQLNAAVASGDFDKIQHSLTEGIPNLQVIVYRMYAPGLFSDQYRDYVGKERCNGIAAEVTALQEKLRSYVWLTQRIDEEQKQPTTIDDLKNFASALEYIADQLESLVPEGILVRYLDDLSAISREMLAKDDLSEDNQIYFRKMLSGVEDARIRLEGRRLLQSPESLTLPPADIALIEG